jgi:hypothetical protein
MTTGHNKNFYKINTFFWWGGRRRMKTNKTGAPGSSISNVSKA